MRLQQDSLTRTKNFIHAAQAFVIFLAWILTIAVYVASGSTDGRTSWFFALCWLSIPILIYLVMTPMWSRTARFANVYASAALDAFSVVLWLSAWAAVAAYVNAGKSKGKGTNTKASGCDNFGLGSATKCKLSEATIILGVIVMLLFVATSYISFQGVAHYRRTGEMPAVKPANDFAAQTQDAFSSNIRTDDFDDEAGFDARQGGGQSGVAMTRQDEDEYALLHQADNEDLGRPPPSHASLPVPYGQGSNAPHDYDTSYSGAYGRHSPSSFQEMDYGGPPPTYAR